MSHSRHLPLSTLHSPRTIPHHFVDPTNAPTSTPTTSVMLPCDKTTQEPFAFTAKLVSVDRRPHEAKGPRGWAEIPTLHPPGEPYARSNSAAKPYVIVFSPGNQLTSTWKIQGFETYIAAIDQETNESIQDYAVPAKPKSIQSYIIDPNSVNPTNLQSDQPSTHSPNQNIKHPHNFNMYIIRQGLHQKFHLGNPCLLSLKALLKPLTQRHNSRHHRGAKPSSIANGSAQTTILNMNHPTTRRQKLIPGLDRRHILHS
ncbi:hypothetical protein CCMA1212_009476 [Trichoderma ghanense]|uniref:Uncharacterized protein n=1 Tax=Trichoderma ghanense TaxID=65468 RepID=A0ABY2GS06_9HYPO